MFAEKHLQFSMSTRMAVMRQYVSLSGSMGVDNLVTHFQHEFLTAWKRNFEGGGHSLGSAAVDILRNAAWMKPSSASGYQQPTMDLSQLTMPRNAATGSSLASQLTGPASPGEGLTDDPCDDGLLATTGLLGVYHYRF